LSPRGRASTLPAATMFTSSRPRPAGAFDACAPEEDFADAITWTPVRDRDRVSSLAMTILGSCCCSDAITIFGSCVCVVTFSRTDTVLVLGGTGRGEPAGTITTSSGGAAAALSLDFLFSCFSFSPPVAVAAVFVCCCLFFSSPAVASAALSTIDWKGSRNAAVLLSGAGAAAFPFFIAVLDEDDDDALDAGCAALFPPPCLMPAAFSFEAALGFFSSGCDALALGVAAFALGVAALALGVLGLLAVPFAVAEEPAPALALFIAGAAPFALFIAAVLELDEDAAGAGASSTSWCSASTASTLLFRPGFFPFGGGLLRVPGASSRDFSPWLFIAFPVIGRKLEKTVFFAK